MPGVEPVGAQGARTLAEVADSKRCPMSRYRAGRPDETFEPEEIVSPEKHAPKSGAYQPAEFVERSVCSRSFKTGYGA